jgi:hypothetical protein
MHCIILAEAVWSKMWRKKDENLQVIFSVLFIIPPFCFITISGMIHGYCLNCGSAAHQSRMV